MENLREKKRARAEAFREKKGGGPLRRKARSRVLGKTDENDRKKGGGDTGNSTSI